MLKAMKILMVCFSDFYLFLIFFIVFLFFINIDSVVQCTIGSNYVKTPSAVGSNAIPISIDTSPAVIGDMVTDGKEIVKIFQKSGDMKIK